MSRTSKTVNLVPPIFRYNALNLLMYGYVTGVRSTLHTITIEAAIRQFIEVYGLSEDEFKIESAKVCFNDMQNHLMNYKKVNQK